MLPFGLVIGDDVQAASLNLRCGVFGDRARKRSAAAQSPAFTKSTPNGVHCQTEDTNNSIKVATVFVSRVYQFPHDLVSIVDSLVFTGENVCSIIQSKTNLNRGWWKQCILCYWRIGVASTPENRQ
jgi:hypothetical protein